MFGMMINGKHTYRDYGMRMTDMVIPMPKVQEERITIPLSNGTIDLKDTYYSTGRYYREREGVEFVFVMNDRSYKEWSWKKSKLANDIHGKKVKVILDNEPNYYYIMRLNVEASKKNKLYSKIKLSGTAYPFKHGVYDDEEKL